MAEGLIKSRQVKASRRCAHIEMGHTQHIGGAGLQGAATDACHTAVGIGATGQDLGAAAGLAQGQLIATVLGQITGETAAAGTDGQKRRIGRAAGVVAHHTATDAIEFFQALIEARHIEGGAGAGQIESAAVVEHVGGRSPHGARADDGRAAIAVVGAEHQAARAVFAQAAHATACADHGVHFQGAGTTNACVGIQHHAIAAADIGRAAGGQCADAAIAATA